MRGHKRKDGKDDKSTDDRHSTGAPRKYVAPVCMAGDSLPNREDGDLPAGDEPAAGVQVVCLRVDDLPGACLPAGDSQMDDSPADGLSLVGPDVHVALADFSPAAPAGSVQMPEDCAKSS
ncbi:MAG TPA: hypothetical protein VFC34_16685 [Puia sp.]|nr:hypothetical protein [Puia sp.]